MMRIAACCLLGHARTKIMHAILCVGYKQSGKVKEKPGPYTRTHMRRRTHKGACSQVSKQKSARVCSPAAQGSWQGRPARRPSAQRSCGKPLAPPGLLQGPAAHSTWCGRRPSGGAGRRRQSLHGLSPPMPLQPQSAPCNAGPRCIASGPDDCCF